MALVFETIISQVKWIINVTTSIRWSILGSNALIKSFVAKSTKAYESSIAVQDEYTIEKEYHRRLWDDDVGSMLALMMRLAGYAEESQAIHRVFFKEHVARSLGPYPTRSETKALWKSFMTDDHTPLEMSWSWSEKSVTPVVRYAAEPIGWLAGTESDPLNSKATGICLGNTLPWAPNLDLEWYRHFLSSLVVADTRNKQSARTTTATEPLSQTFIAFDLGKGSMTVKYYFLPALKSTACCKTNLELIEESILRMPETDNSLAASLEAMTAYMRSQAPENQLQAEIFAVDCVNPADSRLKIYVRSRNTTFNSMLDVMTLGGRTSKFADDTVTSLEELWCACFAVENTAEARSEPLKGKDHRTGGLLYYFELKPGAKLPTSKAYLPVRHYAESDDQVARGLSDYLLKRGKRLDGGLSYYEGVAKLCTHRSLRDGLGFQTYITCAVKNDRVSVNAYLNPETFRGVA